MRFTVTSADTAIALGSGDVPVLATPRLLAWVEAATVAAAADQLDAGQTSVGIHVDLRHRRATVVGASVRVEVASVERSGARLVFEAAAFEDGSGVGDSVPIATARITRSIVDRADFLGSLGKAG